MRDGRFIDTHFKHTIPRVTLQDAGSYTCSADNGLGKDGKKELQVDVLYGPVVTLQNNMEVQEQDDVQIGCQVDANPRPTSIQWYVYTVAFIVLISAAQYSQVIRIFNILFNFDPCQNK